MLIFDFVTLSLSLCIYIQLNIRHLKAGIRMVPSIAALGRKCAHALIKHGVIEKLCELLVVRHMASPLKLLSLKAVDSLLDFPQGIERFLGWTELQVNTHEDSAVLVYYGWGLHIHSLVLVSVCT